MVLRFTAIRNRLGALVPRLQDMLGSRAKDLRRRQTILEQQEKSHARSRISST